jgi:threonine dehydrogenase-like Zn-dependent dehydrogenase
VTNEQLGFTRPGGGAELVVVPGRVVHRLPDGVTLEEGVLVEPMSIVLRALTRAHLSSGESAGVVGIGALGALAVVLAKRSGAVPIVAFGVRDEELELATRLGADRAIDARVGGVADDELDVVVETAGTVRAIELAIRTARPGGRVGLLGSPDESTPLGVPASRFVRKDLAVVGTLSYTSAAWGETLAVLGDGLDLHEIVAATLPVSEFREAFRVAEHPGHLAGRVVLRHEPG